MGLLSSSDMLLALIIAIMKSKLILSALVLGCVLAVSTAVSAQTTGTMPTLYNSSGQSVNTSGGTLQRGYYFLSPSGTGSQVYYYGDGTYYNFATGAFEGNVANSTGGAGSYMIPAATTGGSGTGGTVGIPNTGVGGDAGVAWAVLAMSAFAAALGVLYIVRARRA
jgi:hypothetical protein